MFTMEFDINVAEQVWKEEALARGRKIGRQEGRAEGRQEESMEDFMRLRERLKSAGNASSV
jgi:predicted transposase YdaD